MSQQRTKTNENIVQQHAELLVTQDRSMLLLS